MKKMKKLMLLLLGACLCGGVAFGMESAKPKIELQPDHELFFWNIPKKVAGPDGRMKNDQRCCNYIKGIVDERGPESLCLEGLEGSILDYAIDENYPNTIRYILSLPRNIVNSILNWEDHIKTKEVEEEEEDSNKKDKYEGKLSSTLFKAIKKDDRSLETAKFLAEHGADFDLKYLDEEIDNIVNHEFEYVWKLSAPSNRSKEDEIIEMKTKIRLFIHWWSHRTKHVMKNILPATREKRHYTDILICTEWE